MCAMHEKVMPRECDLSYSGPNKLNEGLSKVEFSSFFNIKSTSFIIRLVQMRFL